LALLKFAAKEGDGTAHAAVGDLIYFGAVAGNQSDAARHYDAAVRSGDAVEAHVFWNLAFGWVF
jgi:hypothetical protein